MEKVKELYNVPQSEEIVVFPQGMLCTSGTGENMDPSKDDF